MSMAMHCDGPECNAWVVSGWLADGWLTVSEWGEGDSNLHFCYWDCLLKYGASKEPIEVV